MRRLVPVIALTLALAPHFANAAAVIEIPPQNGLLPGAIWDLSRDGTAAAAECWSEAEQGWVACRWRVSTGLEALTDPAHFTGSFMATSRDGSVVVGTLSEGGVNRPVRWGPEGNAEVLAGSDAFVSGIARDVSADGSVVVGQVELPGSIWRAFRWTSANGFELAPDANAYVASAVSADGSVVAGCCLQRGFAHWPARPFVWHVSDGSLRPIAKLHPYGDFAWGLSADGRYVAASLDGASLPGFAWRWSEGRAPRLVARPSEEIFQPVAHAISADGSVIVGSDGFFGSSFLWDPSHGVRMLKDELAARGIDVSGWQTVAYSLSISDDGLRIPATVFRADGTSSTVIAVLAPACSDGVDNDGDGAIDSADGDCAGPADDDETAQSAGLGAGIVVALVPLAPLALIRRRTVGAALLLLLVPAAARSAVVRPLETTQNGVTFAPSALSGDGQVLAGSCRAPGGPWRPCRWRIGIGPEFLESAAGDEAAIRDASYDGSVVVGDRKVGLYREATRWLADGHAETLPAPGSFDNEAFFVSPDGATVSGLLGAPRNAFHWTSETGVQVVSAPDVPFGFWPLSSDAFLGKDAQGSFLLPFGGTRVHLPDAAGRSWSAFSASQGGDVAIGSRDTVDGQLTVWTPESGTTLLEPLIYPFFLAPQVAALSADGTFAVGRDDVAGAWVWQRGVGLMRLADLLRVRHGIATPQWDFLGALLVSDDGRIVVADAYEGDVGKYAIVDLTPACSDGVDNDGDGAIDLADAECADASGLSESPPPHCGLGFELAAVAPLLAALRRRKRRSAAAA